MTLSDKRYLANIERGRRYEPMYPEEDVKDFIQKLKEERINLFKKIKRNKMGSGIIDKKDWDLFMINCDKLAGDALIHSPGKIKALQTPPAQDTPDAVGGKTSRQSSGTHGQVNSNALAVKAMLKKKKPAGTHGSGKKETNSLRKRGINSGFWETTVIPAILKRDNHKCTRCESTENLHVHHKDYDNQVYDNLITLCKKCHNKQHSGSDIASYTKSELYDNPEGSDNQGCQNKEKKQ